MQTRRLDDLVINRWRVEPRIRGIEFGDMEEQEQAPPLWKDLTLASLLAMMLWAAAAAVFG